MRTKHVGCQSIAGAGAKCLENKGQEVSRRYSAKGKQSSKAFFAIYP
jgi:hypothetical protein